MPAGEQQGESVEPVARAFGAENRQRLIDSYFAAHGFPASADVSRDIYRLLLCIDRTTGLAHCYESDKSARLEAAGQKFDYVLVTNEFDAARMVAACDSRVGNQPLFDTVAHVDLHAVLATYGPELRTSAARLPDLIDAGRLVGVSDWLSSLSGRPQ